MLNGQSGRRSDSTVRFGAEELCHDGPVCAEFSSLRENPNFTAFSPKIVALHSRSDDIPPVGGHVSSQPILERVFAIDARGRKGAGVNWEGIVIGAFLAAFMALGGVVIFQVAAFGALFVDKTTTLGGPFGNLPGL